jgi:hypothetical protein
MTRSRRINATRGKGRSLFQRSLAELEPFLSRRILIATALVLAGLNFLVRYPGDASDLDVYREVLSGNVTDWVPPVMTRLWAAFHQVMEGPAPMFALQLLLHWLGFGLIADGLHQIDYRKLSFLVLLSGASPLFLFYTGQIYKDVLLASTLITFFGIIFWFKVRGSSAPAVVLVLALVIWAFGTLLRANAIFASAPLLIYALLGARRRSLTVWVLLIRF